MEQVTTASVEVWMGAMWTLAGIPQAASGGSAEGRARERMRRLVWV